MRALMITGSQVQDHEFIYPYYRLKEAGFDVVVALKDGEKTKGIMGTNIPCDDLCEVISYESIWQFMDYDVLIIPGGAKCMEKLRQEKAVLEFIKTWHSKRKIIGSICHGAQMLISSIDLDDYHIAGYYSIEDDIKNANASYCRTYCCSGNIISASHYKYSGEWMKLVLEALC